MALKPSNKCRKRKHLDTEINIVPLMSLMVILIPFLLLTAVFGKTSILNLYLPTDTNPQDSQSPPPAQQIIPTVAITQNGFILGKGKGNTKRIPLKNNQHDFDQLREYLIEYRQEPNISNSIIILPEAGIIYQLLITTMDTCRKYKTEQNGIKPLFPVISLGEYQAKLASKSP